jgi:hypothetical protein
MPIVKTRGLFLILPPLLAAAAMAAWAGKQKAEIRTVEAETAEIDLLVAAARQEAEPSAAERLGQSRNGEQGPDQMDWAALARDVLQMQREGPARMRGMLRLHRMMLEWSADDFDAALAQIGATQLSDQQSDALIQLVADRFLDQHPHRALDSLAPMLAADSPLMWQLGNALQKLAHDDPAAASAWLDKQIASGALEGKSLEGGSRGRSVLEARLASALLESDPAAAIRRLEAIPGPDRVDTFNQIPNLYEKPAAFAAIRSVLKPDEQSRVFANAATQAASSGGLERAARFFEEAGFTTEERSAAVSSAATGSLRRDGRSGSVTHEQVGSVREWISTQAPGSEDRATGEALANLARPWETAFKVEDAVAIVSRFHDEGAGDEMIAGFVKQNQHRANHAQMRPLLEKVRDQELKNELSQILR